MCVHGGIADSAPESGLWPGSPHLALSIRIFARQTKVKHVDLASGAGQAAHRKVGRLHVPMKKPDRMYVLYADEDLRTQSESGAEREALLGLSTPQLGQVLALQTHDHVVEVFGGAAANEAAHVVLALQAPQHGHLHLEHLLGLFGGLEFERHLFLGNQVKCLVDLSEAAAAYFACLKIKLFIFDSGI